MVALPFLKIIFLGVRQVTRPIAKQVVERAKEGRKRQLCIALGRLSLGVSGTISEWTFQEEIKAKSLKEKETDPSTEPVKGEASRSKTKVTAGCQVTTPRSRSLLGSISYGPLPELRYDPTVFLQKGGAEAFKVLVQYPYQGLWEMLRRRFFAPYPEDKLVDAGAALLLELVAFFVLAGILTYELSVQFKATAKKEALLYYRIQTLEDKLLEVEQKLERIEAQTKRKGARWSLCGVQ